MRQIDLKEWEPSEPEALSMAERDSLNAALPSVAMRPVLGESDQYRLTPGSTVGAVEMSSMPYSRSSR